MSNATTATSNNVDLVEKAIRSEQIQHGDNDAINNILTLDILFKAY